MNFDYVSITLHAVVVIYLTLASCGNFGSIFGCSWWTYKEPDYIYEFGILRECITSSKNLTRKCTFRKTLFMFNVLLEDEDLIPDIILVLFFVAIAFNIVALSSSIFLCFQWKNKETWRIICVIISTFGMLGGQSNATGMVYAQILTNKMSAMHGGWTLILSWITTVIHLLGAILSYCILRFPPIGHRQGRVILRNNDMSLSDKNSNRNIENIENKKKIETKIDEDTKYFDDRGFVIPQLDQVNHTIIITNIKTLMKTIRSGFMELFGKIYYGDKIIMENITIFNRSSKNSARARLIPGSLPFTKFTKNKYQKYSVQTSSLLAKTRLSTLSIKLKKDYSEIDEVQNDGELRVVII
ncbi:uncharacterized protein LOC124816189 isoform X2 [Hydra vulgaris]|uniref:Uncharacterized protein LOC124816189 isoform X2 n=1 Tax=Hydra vulgaris TaxID=6087 RepID=A0ABM4CRQ2_HYDVU